MKRKSIRTLISVIRLPASALCLLALALIPGAMRADNQGYPSTLATCTNTPPVLNSGSSSNFTSVIQLHNYSGLALEAVLGATSNANVGIFIEPSVDGTNFATAPWVWTIPLNGPTNVVTTNWDYLRLRGYQALQISQMTNGGPAAVTNISLIFNRPNN